MMSEELQEVLLDLELGLFDSLSLIWREVLLFVLFHITFLVGHELHQVVLQCLWYFSFVDSGTCSFTHLTRVGSRLTQFCILLSSTAIWYQKVVE
jgi:hypothetical protein